MDKWGRLINQSSNKKKSQNDKLNKMLLIIKILVDLDQFTQKYKPVINIKIFVEFYNQINHKQVFEIYRMIELKKIYILTTKNLHNLGTY